MENDGRDIRQGILHIAPQSCLVQHNLERMEAQISSTCLVAVNARNPEFVVFGKEMQNAPQFPRKNESNAT